MNRVVSIKGIAAGGDGVGRYEGGKVVFVPRTAPGDQAEIEVVRTKSRYAKGRLIELLRGGPGRVDPRCRHFVEDSCGGCQLQHMSATAQLEAKSNLVGEAVRRIGRLEVDDPPVVASQSPWRYRTKITLAAIRRTIGLRKIDRPESTFELTDCLISSEPLMALWAAVSVRRELLPDGLESLVLREDRTGRLHLIAVGGERRWEAERLAVELSNDSVSLWWKPARGAARVVHGPQVGFPATAFEQSNRATAQQIRHRLVDLVGDLTGMVAWDLYGGVGDTADLMASRGAEVWSVERDRGAVEWGERHGAKQVKRIAGFVEEAFGRLPEPDLVVANPPRVGIGKSVSRWLDSWARSARRPRLAYVSCDPATLARDIARMANFKVVDLEAYDLFPQTAHVEVLAMMEAA